MGVYIDMEMPTSCEDCPMCHSNAEYDYAYCCVSSAETSGNKIPSDCPLVPAADVRPIVRGRWIDRDDDYYGWNMWACSACGEEFVLTEGTPDMNDYHFCPNCGADMREP